MKKSKPLLSGFILLTALIFSGCGAKPSLQVTPQATPVEIVNVPVSTSFVESTAQPEAAQTETVSADQLIIWVPPEFNPASTKAGLLLQEQITLFMQNHPGVEIRLRIKESDGPAGILSALDKTLLIAPKAAPSLVLLPDNDLEAAAMQGLIQSSADFQSLLEEDDWYEYAREMSLFQNGYYGIPFAADAMILSVRKANEKPLSVNWKPLLSSVRPLLFPAADKQALFTISLYLSAGGSFFDEQNNVRLDMQILEKVLQFYNTSYSTGYILPNVMDYADDEQVWRAFKEKRASQVICKISDYFSQNASDVIGLTIPPLGNEPTTIINGWVWTLTDPNQNHLELDMELLQQLTAADFQASVAFTGGLLPVRPSSLSKWEDPVRTALISQATISAVSQPQHDILNLFGPILNEAVYNVITKKALPSEAARDAAQDINTD